MGLVKTVSDPLLANVISGIAQKVKPADSKQYNAIIMSGMQMLFSPKTVYMLKRGLAGGPITSVIPQGIANLIAMISHQAQGQMDPTAAAQASIVLMAHALDFAERSGYIAVYNIQTTGKAKLSPQLLAKITQSTATAVLAKLGMTQQVINNAANQMKGQSNGNA